jgi:hypothetical protein
MKKEERISYVINLEMYSSQSYGISSLYYIAEEKFVNKSFPLSSILFSCMRILLFFFLFLFFRYRILNLVDGYSMTWHFVHD